MRLVFSYLVGNSDMHLKKFSLLETAVGTGVYVLSPAYDLLPVDIIMPEDREQFALSMNGKKTNLRRKDFLVFAESMRLSRKSAENMMDRMLSLQPHFSRMCEQSLLPKDLSKAFMQLMKQRTKQLEKSSI